MALNFSKYVVRSILCLFEFDEVLIGLSQTFDWFLTPPVIEVDVFEQLSQRQHIFRLVCRLKLWVFSDDFLYFLINLSILFGVCLLKLYFDLLDSIEVVVVFFLKFHLFYLREIDTAIGVVSSFVLIVWLALVLDKRLLFSAISGSLGVHDGSLYLYSKNMLRPRLHGTIGGGYPNCLVTTNVLIKTVTQCNW